LRALPGTEAAGRASLVDVPIGLTPERWARRERG
jgi:hypothetical protein